LKDERFFRISRLRAGQHWREGDRAQPRNYLVAPRRLLFSRSPDRTSRLLFWLRLLLRQKISQALCFHGAIVLGSESFSQTRVASSRFSPDLVFFHGVAGGLRAVPAGYALLKGGAFMDVAGD